MKEDLRKTALICCGGSGGHVFPALDLAAKMDRSFHVIFAGHRLSKNLFFLKKYPSYDVQAAPFSFLKIPSFIGVTILGIFQAFYVLLKVNPKIVVGFGSYHTFPLMLVSAILRKKILLFEANCALGKVNRLFSPFAKKVVLQFPLKQSIKHSEIVERLPWKLPKGTLKSRHEAAVYFGLKEDVFTILVFGGSQGAKFFNEFLPSILSEIPEIQILHFTGKTKAIYKCGHVCVKEFEARMDLAYSLANLAITRAGAGTIAELITFELPALLIPYPFSGDKHQEVNAEYFACKIGGGSFLLEKDASKESVQKEIQNIRLNLNHLKQNLKSSSLEKKKDILAVCHEL